LLWVIEFGLVPPVSVGSRLADSRQEMQLAVSGLLRASGGVQKKNLAPLFEERGH